MTKMPPETVFAAFEQTALRWPERDFLTVMPDTAEVYGIPAGTITYHTAYHESLSRAEAFDAAGYRRGMRVAVLLENRPDYFLIWLALNRLGVSVVPINPDLRQSEQTYLIGHSEPALVIAIPARQEELRKAATSAGLSVDVIGPGDSIPVPKGGGTVADILDGEAQEAALLYTSGTTGHPKGCVLPNTLPLGGGMVPQRWGSCRPERNGGTDDHSAPRLSHERDGLFLYGDGCGGRMPYCTGSFSSRDMVVRCQKLRRDLSPLSWGDAHHVDARAAIAQRPNPFRKVWLWCRDRSQIASGL